MFAELPWSGTVRLAGPDGAAFELTIDRYQYPALEATEYDSNWLVVSVRVAHPRGNWRASDAALLTYEAQRLADWLDGIAEDAPLGSEESFIEPELAFRVVSGPQGTCLRVMFGLGLRPGGAELATADTGDVYIDVPLQSSDLRAAAADLRAQLQKHPQRAPV